MDEQIANLLRCEGLISMPLVRSAETVGAILIGLDNEKQKSLLAGNKAA